MRIKLLLPVLLMLATASYGQHHHCATSSILQREAAANPQFAAELAAYQAAIPDLERAGMELPQRSVVYIPVVFHVIHNGVAVGQGANISDARIQQQIDRLNLDYRRQNADANQTPAPFAAVAADCEIQFCLASVDPSGNPTNGITRHQYNVTSETYIETILKPATDWNSNNYLNVWTIIMPQDLNGVLGYAFPPLPSIVGTAKDGLVLNYLNVGNNPQAFPPSLGRTATHEVGHYLGLPHPWSDINGNGGCAYDDGVADTPNSNDAVFNCPSYPFSDACVNSVMFMNFMDYVDDNCMNTFTTGQKAVMRAVLAGNYNHNGTSYRSRLSLVNAGLTQCSQPPACVDLLNAPISTGFEPGQNNAWVIENTNNDLQPDNSAATWIYNTGTNGEYGPDNGTGYAVYFYNQDNATAANDWLFTPCFQVQAGHSYRVNFTYACARANNITYAERFRVTVNSDQTSGSELLELDDFTNVNNFYPSYRDTSLYFSSNINSTVAVGLHCYSLADKYALQIDNMNIIDLVNNSVEGLELPAFEFTISPNPTVSESNIYIGLAGQSSDATVTVYNALGQPLKEFYLEPAMEHHLNLNVTDYPNGVYFLSAVVGGERVTKTFVVQK